jgi:hypothetical protein
MALTVKATPLHGPGGYTTNTPTLKGGAGQLKVFGGGTPNVRKTGTLNASPTFESKGAKRGHDSYTTAALKNIPRTIVP